MNDLTETSCHLNTRGNAFFIMSWHNLVCNLSTTASNIMKHMHVAGSAARIYFVTELLPYKQD